MDIYLATATTFTKLDSAGKEKYKKQTPRITACVGACRPSGDNYGAIKALHAYSETNLLNYSKQLWIRIEDKMQSSTKANELFNIINNKTDKK